MVNTKVTLCGIEMDNPIIPASGTFGYGYEFAELYDINMLGTFSFKGTTREPRFGNPTPRIAEYAGGLLNAVGLQNPGVDAVIETELPKLKQVFHKPVMANVSGFSVAEYAEVCEKLDAQEQVGWLEVNISCPNVHGGGAAFGADPKSAAEVTKAVRAVTKKPIILKLSPTAADIAAVARACEDAGADGVSLINTLPGMRIDLKRRASAAGQHHRRYVRPGDVPAGGADGVSGLRGSVHPHRGHGRRHHGGGRHRADAGGRRCRRRGRGEPCGAVCLQDHYRRSACRDGTVRHGTI